MHPKLIYCRSTLGSHLIASLFEGLERLICQSALGQLWQQKALPTTNNCGLSTMLDFSSA